MQFVILYGLDDQIQVGIILWEGRHDKDLTEATRTAIDFFVVVDRKKSHND